MIFFVALGSCKKGRLKQQRRSGVEENKRKSSFFKRKCKTGSGDVGKGYDYGDGGGSGSGSGYMYGWIGNMEENYA